MSRVKKIYYHQTEGLTRTELVEPPQSLVSLIQVPLNFYAIFWLASVIVYTITFFRNTSFKETVVIWPDKNEKRLEDILLPETTLSYLTEWICFLRHGKRNGISPLVPKGILLVGPPGTGKTTLAQAFAYESKLPIVCETVSHFYSGSRNVWVKIRDIFRLAQKWSPSILFLDDMGTLGSRPQDPVTVTQKGVLTPHMFKSKAQLRKTKEGYSIKELAKKSSCHKELSLLTHFLIELDGLRKRKDVIVIGATHSLEGMDQALLRPGRFERIIWLKPLNERQRITLLQHNFAKVGQTLKQDEWQYLSQFTFGLNGASLQSIVHKLVLQNRGSKDVTVEQIEKALQQLRSQLHTRKFYKKESNLKNSNKGLELKKWWIQELQSGMTNIPQKGWNSFYSHEPLGDWYQQAFVEGNNLPKWNVDVAGDNNRDSQML